MLKIEELESNECLNEEEYRLFDMIRECSKVFDPIPEVRVVGGWVRDHLLGINSNDIDIMIFPISNREFANKMAEMFPDDVSKVASNEITESRIEHFLLVKIILKSGTVVEVSNCYADGSHYKIVADAIRRDISINGLFFNVLTNKIEDYVGGIDDLRNKICRTPRQPSIAFHENQIHVIRACRFAAKYNLSFNDEMVEAAQQSVMNPINPLTYSLAQMEVGKAMNDNDPARFINLLIKCKYFDLVFGKYHWNYNDILDRVNTMNKRFPNGNRSLEFLGAICSSLMISNPGISKRQLSAVDFGTNASLIVLAANLIPNLMNIFTRKSVAFWIRYAKEHWKTAIHLPYEEDVFNFASNDLKNFIEKENLGDIYKVQPLMNGNESSKLMNKKAGKWLQEFNDLMFEWQVLNPEGTKEDFQQYALMNLQNM